MVVRMVLMTAERKISDEDLRLLRLLAEAGEPPGDLADRFAISVQHVGRLLRGERRPPIASWHDDDKAVGVADAVAAFLAEGTDLSGADEVLAATARVLARKLDGCAASDAAASAQAMPRLAAELASVLDALRDGVPREPDAVDVLRARRDHRLANRDVDDGPHFNNGNKRGRESET